MILRPPRSTRTDTLFPYTTLFRSRPRKGEPNRTDQFLDLVRSGGISIPAAARELGIGPNYLYRIAGTLESEGTRSEEHTSELQSLMRISYAVFCLKKKKKRYKDTEELNRSETDKLLK